MTPEKARELLVDLDLESLPPYEALPTRGKLFEVRDKERNLVADSLAKREAALVVAAPALAELVAGLRYVYAVQVQPVPGGAWHQVTEWTPDSSPVKGRELEHDERIIRRLVGDPEVVK